MNEEKYDSRYTEKKYIGKIVYQADEAKIFNLNHMSLVARSNQGGEATTNFVALLWDIDITLDETRARVRDTLEIKDEDFVSIEQTNAEVAISPRFPMKINIEAMAEAYVDLFKREDDLVFDIVRHAVLVKGHKIKIDETGRITVNGVLSIENAWEIVNDLDIINIIESFIEPE